MTDLLDSPQSPETLAIPDESLWVIRLRLAWTTFQKNWKLFRSNFIGLIGLGIILMFGLMAVLQPILLDGLKPLNTLGLFALTWPVIGFSVSIAISVLCWIGRKAGVAEKPVPTVPAWLSGVGALILVVIVGFTIANVWDSATFDTQVGTELNPPCVDRVVVEEVTDIATQMSTREAILYPTSTGFPPAVGETVTVCEQPAAPYGRHLLGTDPLGRDVPVTTDVRSQGCVPPREYHSAGHRIHCDLRGCGWPRISPDRSTRDS